MLWTTVDKPELREVAPHLFGTEADAGLPLQMGREAPGRPDREQVPVGLGPSFDRFPEALLVGRGYLRRPTWARGIGQAAGPALQPAVLPVRDRVATNRQDLGHLGGGFAGRQQQKGRDPRPDTTRNGACLYTLETPFLGSRQTDRN